MKNRKFSRVSPWKQLGIYRNYGQPSKMDRGPKACKRLDLPTFNATTRRQWMAFDLAKGVPKKGVVFVDHFRHFRSRMYLGLVRCSNLFDFQ